MKSLRRLGVATVAAGSLLLTGGLWLPAKAAVAQLLLRHAWARSHPGPVRPWPWARTWPVAQLRVPRLGVDRIVLAGDQGAALAFAPGHVDGTAAPGEPGNTALAGHRDTVFAFLSELRLGDAIELESATGARQLYIVTDSEVVHERDARVLQPTADATLTLVTCYPLDGTRPNGPLRYVVRATAPGVPGPISLGAGCDLRASIDGDAVCNVAIGQRDVRSRTTSGERVPSRGSAPRELHGAGGPNHP